MRLFLVAAAGLAVSVACADEIEEVVAACLSCHIQPDGQIDIVGIRALAALPAEWQLLYEDVYDLDGDGIAGQVQYVSGGGQPLIAKWGRKLAAARFRDFALIAGAAHDVPVDNAAALAAAQAAFEKRSPDPGLPFSTQEAQADFEARGCAGCHVTRSFSFEGRRYMPLSDFLLHDLGEGPVRTAPLWGCESCLEGDPHAQAAASE